MIGKILLFLTFPGAIINTVIKQLLCRILRVAVYDKSYFNPETFSGKVIHEVPKKFTQQLMVVILPFIIGTLLGVAMAFSGSLAIDDKGALHLLYFVSVWLGVAVVVQSVPKVEYAQKMLKRLWSKETGFFTKLFCSPFLAVIYLANMLTFFEIIAVVYGVVIVYIPVMILERM